MEVDSLKATEVDIPFYHPHNQVVLSLGDRDGRIPAHLLRLNISDYRRRVGHQTCFLSRAPSNLVTPLLRGP